MNASRSYGLISVIFALLALTGCTHTSVRPHTALRSPSSYNDATALLFRARAPKPDIVVELPNHPGGKVRVRTVADGLFGKPPPRPMRPHPLPVQTSIHVEMSPNATAPATQPATGPASTQPAATQPAPTGPAATQPASTQPASEPATAPTTEPATR